MSKYRVASLFAGIGGMDLGIMGGFSFNGISYTANNTDLVYSMDFQKEIVDIYNQNFEHQAVVADVRHVDSAELPDHDILMGGFPCQSFSIVAQNPKRLGYNDEKGMLFFEMCRILREKKPRAFIAENVKGILSANKREAFPLIMEEFRKVGYHVTHAVINAAHFGVPQKRERVFIVGFRSKAEFEKFKFPVGVTVNTPTPLRSVLEDDSVVDEKYYFSQRAVDGMLRSRTSKIMNKGRAQDIDGPCNTVGAHLAKVSLNSTDPVLLVNGRYRMFTPREVARIQSFPDSFVLSDSRRWNYVGLGNAVAPVVMWHVSNAVLEALNSVPSQKEGSSNTALLTV